MGAVDGADHAQEEYQDDAEGDDVIPGEEALTGPRFGEGLRGPRSEELVPGGLPHGPAPVFQPTPAGRLSMPLPRARARSSERLTR